MNTALILDFKVIDIGLKSEMHQKWKLNDRIQEMITLPYSGQKIGDFVLPGTEPDRLDLVSRMSSPKSTACNCDNSNPTICGKMSLGEAVSDWRCVIHCNCHCHAQTRQEQK